MGARKNGASPSRPPFSLVPISSKRQLHVHVRKLTIFCDHIHRFRSKELVCGNRRTTYGCLWINWLRSSWKWEPASIICLFFIWVWKVLPNDDNIFSLSARETFNSFSEEKFCEYMKRATLPEEEFAKHRKAIRELLTN